MSSPISLRPKGFLQLSSLPEHTLPIHTYSLNLISLKILLCPNALWSLSLHSRWAIITLGASSYYKIFGSLKCLIHKTTE